MMSKDTDFPVPFKHIQFPVLGVYYLSFNWAQGQSPSKLGIHLPISVITQGHLNVDLSRVGDPTQVSVYADQNEFYNVREHMEEGRT